MSEKVLTVKNLVTQLKTEQGFIKAVNGVSFEVYQGKTLGLVGESGSGKSVTALSIMQLIANAVGSIVEGEVWLTGKNLLQLSSSAMRMIRGKQIAMIFQDPMASLNPVLPVGYQIQEVFALHQSLTPKDVQDHTIELLRSVGISEPEKRIRAYPHQLSGGMQQRVMIAMALAGNPDVLIADEPTTALDVTIQAQILDLLTRLQEELGMSMILITHDLGIVAEVCHEVAVMYAGKIVERAPTKALFSHPKHPYTQGLIASIPAVNATQDKAQQRLATISGIVPDLTTLPLGCSFQDRCYSVEKDCSGEQGTPLLEEKAPEHHAACFHPLPND